MFIRFGKDYRKRRLATIMAKSFSGVPTVNVFAHATAMSKYYKSVNLGQGFPSFPVDDYVKDFVIEAIKNNKNQYTRPGGTVELVETLADRYSNLLNEPIDPMKNICVYGGAQQGIFVSFSVLCEPGDEIVCIEPAFDSYRKSAEYLKLKYVPVSMDKDFTVSKQKLVEAVTEKTKMLLLNTPHNPTGKVFSKAELLEIIAFLDEFPNLHILSDEVYEFLVFEGLEHFYLRALASEDQKRRIISLSSAGKSFSCTGWRIGYSIASEDITKRLINAQSVMTFCNVTPIETGFAKAFKHEPEHGGFKKLAKLLDRNRAKLKTALDKIPGVHTFNPQGGYFIIVDFTEIAKNIKFDGPEQALDFKFNEWLTKEVGVTGIPLSAFSTHNPDPKRCQIRLAFCKTDEELDKAILCLKNLESI